MLQGHYNYNYDYDYDYDYDYVMQRKYSCQPALSRIRVGIIGILHIALKVVDTFLRRNPENGAWLQKVSTGK